MFKNKSQDCSEPAGSKTVSLTGVLPAAILCLPG